MGFPDWKHPLLIHDWYAVVLERLKPGDRQRLPVTCFQGITTRELPVHKVNLSLKQESIFFVSCDIIFGHHEVYKLCFLVKFRKLVQQSRYSRKHFFDVSYLVTYLLISFFQRRHLICGFYDNILMPHLLCDFLKSHSVLYPCQMSSTTMF